MKEFILLMAFLTSLIALSIDGMLPALSQMSSDLAVASANDIQYVVGMIFVGITIGMLIYGPISDTIGRRKALFAGLGFFLFGSLICMLAQSLSVMLIGRFLQGFGAAGPRIVTTAIIRDKFKGREMARIMSMVLGVFVFVPALAPAMGQAILFFTSWHGIFAAYILFAVIISGWAYARLEESLPLVKRKALAPKVIWNGFKVAASSRATLGYSICSGVIFSVMLGYIHSAEQIFREIFDAGDMFPIYFGGLAMFLAFAFLANSYLVKRFGMRRITLTALLSASVIASAHLIFFALFGAHLWLYLACTGLLFFSIGLTFGNVSAMALEPMGHIAGLASAFMGSISTFVALALGAAIGQLYDGTLMPLSVGYAAMSILSLALMQWIERGMPHAHHEDLA